MLHILLKTQMVTDSVSEGKFCFPFFPNTPNICTEYGQHIPLVLIKKCIKNPLSFFHSIYSKKRSQLDEIVSRS